MNGLLKTRSAKAATAPTPGATLRPQRILVVDDDSGLRQLGMEVLIRHSYQVDAAEDNTAGRKALRAHTYDPLITDLDMPRSSEKRRAFKTQVRARPAKVVRGVRKLPNPVHPWSESESEFLLIADRAAESKAYLARFNKTKTVVYE